MTLAEDLAALAHDAAARPDADALRARTLTNLAATVGEQTLSASVTAAFKGADDASFAARLAVTMHARTQDDFFPPGRVHVGAIVLPAALAAGEGELLPALAAGYEVMCIISAAYAPVAQSRGLRPSGVFGPIAAAASAAVGAGSDMAGTAHSIALAAAFCGGTNQAWADGSEEWLGQVGVATRAGVEAARMAASGVRAATHAFEGEHGWARAFFDDRGASRLSAMMRSPRLGPGQVACKPFPVSGISQVPTTLAARAWKQHWSDDCRVEVAMCPAELAYPGSANVGPFRSRSDSLMSVARCVAAALTCGRVPFVALGQQPSPAEQSWLDRISVVPDPSLGETEAELRFHQRGKTSVLRDAGRGVLYPTWWDLVTDIEGLAVRSEASIDQVARFAQVIESGVPAEDLKELLP
jgi:2-methylcitrate dehydratase PrpD